MEKYLDAAETIAPRAMGADPLPKKPLQAEYQHRKDKNVRRLDLSTIEATHRVEWDGEYIVRFGMPGERAPDAKPVTLGFWMDGKLLNSMQVETKPSKLVYFNPYSEARCACTCPRATTSSAPASSTTISSRRCPRRSLQHKKNKFLNR